MRHSNFAFNLAEGNEYNSRLDVLLYSRQSHLVMTIPFKVVVFSQKIAEAFEGKIMETFVCAIQPFWVFSMNRAVAFTSPSLPTCVGIAKNNQLSTSTPFFLPSRVDS